MTLGMRMLLSINLYGPVKGQFYRALRGSKRLATLFEAAKLAIHDDKKQHETIFTSWYIHEWT